MDVAILVSSKWHCWSTKTEIPLFSFFNIWCKYLMNVWLLIQQKLIEQMTEPIRCISCLPLSSALECLWPFGHLSPFPQYQVVFFSQSFFTGCFIIGPSWPVAPNFHHTTPQNTVKIPVMDPGSNRRPRPGSSKLTPSLSFSKREVRVNSFC